LAATALATDISLPIPQKEGGMPLMEALAARKSDRSFSSRPLESQALSDLLWAAFGINRNDGKRTAPSARNRQEIDVYVALSSGLYYYNAQQHKLEQVIETDIRELVGKQPFTQTAPVNLIYVSDYERMAGGEEFYSATDTGFISQNVYLYCASAGLNTVVLGWVDKKKLHKAMGLQSTQHVILTQPVGYPPESASMGDRVLRDGVWSGTAPGYSGPIRVAVTVRNGQIKKVEVTDQQESRPADALQQIPGRIKAAGNTKVDAISGATVTSRAIMAAVDNALKKAE
jgi:SagB-type dehydrogenase family enzyme